MLSDSSVSGQRHLELAGPARKITELFQSRGHFAVVDFGLRTEARQRDLDQSLALGGIAAEADAVAEVGLVDRAATLVVRNRLGERQRRAEMRGRSRIVAAQACR